jgi:crotonobetainyl-CoA:carnitine CoA-transferase CaiB-like acyl-CoA transferase
MKTPREIIADLSQSVGLPASMAETIVLTGAEPALPSSFRIGAAAQATIGAVTAAVSEIHARRTGRRLVPSVDMRHAAVEFRSGNYVRLDGKSPPDPWDAIAGLYRCGDGGAVRLHTNFPHHRDGVQRLLGCANDRQAVSAALLAWEAIKFETAATEAGLVVAALRSFAEWDAHPHAASVAGLPAVSLERIGDAPPTPLPGVGDRPLSGIRVLDLTRVIAGPVSGRVLAAHGADVLRITGAHLPSLGQAEIDVGRGKLQAAIDLRTDAGRDTLRRLIAGADIFTQGYRPGTLAGRGFSPEAVAAVKPGIIYVSLSAYGHLGPWAGKRGFDSLVQTTTGINQAEADAFGTQDKPRPLPCQALDHASGYLLALGALAGLLRRADEGGSWLVRVALAGTGHWLRGLGRLSDGFNAPDPGFDDISDLMEETDSGFGRLSALRHAGQIIGAPPFWARPAMPLGSAAAVWSAT